MAESTEFVLDDQLAEDTFALGDFPLSKILLMNDRQYPWLILVPRRPAVSELYELSWPDQQQLYKESAGLGRLLMELFAGHKLNIAALGNVVSQLHVHHIIRYHNDKAWPRPVWGVCSVVPYADVEVAGKKNKLLKALADSNIEFKANFD